MRDRKNGSTNTSTAAEQLIYVFYALGAARARINRRGMEAVESALPLASTTLVLATSTLGIGGYIAYAGGHIRHKEFRFEPAPELHTEEHSEH